MCVYSEISYKKPQKKMHCTFKYRNTDVNVNVKSNAPLNSTAIAIGNSATGQRQQCERGEKTQRELWATKKKLTSVKKRKQSENG